MWGNKTHMVVERNSEVYEMFVHETHSYYIILNLSDSGAYIEQKKQVFEKAMLHMGAEVLSGCGSIWVLNEVMYSSSDDIYDIICAEISRFASQDTSLSEDAVKAREFVSGKDKLIISEYVDDNTFVL